MDIGGIEIGLNHRPAIVAEIGAAHNGSLETAIKLITAAKDAGADVVKVQCYTPETITGHWDRPEFTIAEGPWAGRRLAELYAKAHIPRDWFPKLYAHAWQLGIPMFASVSSGEDVAFMMEFDPPAYKISSFELVDPVLIKQAAMLDKPMILSTGMANWEDIGVAAKQVKPWQTVWLHCVSAYPTELDDARLEMIRVLRRQFDLVGFSDHTITHEAGMMAVALGAVMIEKHITLTPGGEGFDDHFAIGPADFKLFISDLRRAWWAIGGGKQEGPASAKNGADQEHAPLRRSLYVNVDMKAGDRFSADNIRSIRPGLGMAPKHFPEIMGREATMDLPAGTPLATHMIRNWGA